MSWSIAYIWSKGTGPDTNFWAQTHHWNFEFVGFDAPHKEGLTRAQSPHEHLQGAFKLTAQSRRTLPSLHTLTKYTHTLINTWVITRAWHPWERAHYCKYIPQTHTQLCTKHKHSICTIFLTKKFTGYIFTSTIPLLQSIRLCVI